MLKNYIYKGLQFQFEEGKQPEGAVEVKAAKPSEKAVEAKAQKPANKARAVKTK